MDAVCMMEKLAVREDGGKRLHEEVGRAVENPPGLRAARILKRSGELHKLLS